MAETIYRNQKGCYSNMKELKISYILAQPSYDSIQILSFDQFLEVISISLNLHFNVESV